MGPHLCLVHPLALHHWTSVHETHLWACKTDGPTPRVSSPANTTRQAWPKLPSNLSSVPLKTLSPPVSLTMPASLPTSRALEAKKAFLTSLKENNEDLMVPRKQERATISITSAKLGEILLKHRMELMLLHPESPAPTRIRMAFAARTTPRLSQMLLQDACLECNWKKIASNDLPLELDTIWQMVTRLTRNAKNWVRLGKHSEALLARKLKEKKQLLQCCKEPPSTTQPPSAPPALEPTSAVTMQPSSAITMQPTSTATNRTTNPGANTSSHHSTIINNYHSAIISNHHSTNNNSHVSATKSAERASPLEILSILDLQISTELPNFALDCASKSCFKCL